VRVCWLHAFSSYGINKFLSSTASPDFKNIFSTLVMKKIIIGLACVAVFLCGCQSPSNQGAAFAILQGLNQGTQQINQQQMIQQQQWNQELLQQQQQRLQAQQQRQSQGTPAYNSYNNTYQYVPPGWHQIWDEKTHAWIIQP